MARAASPARGDAAAFGHLDFEFANKTLELGVRNHVAAGDGGCAACRADAAAALILGTLQDDGSIVLDPEKTVVHLQLVMDLETLRGEADNPVLLDGSPIPALMGRDLAQHARWWRRVVLLQREDGQAARVSNHQGQPR